MKKHRTTEQWYWVAGLIEGEGCFTVGNRGIGPEIRVAMNDLDVIERLDDIVGYGSVHRQGKQWLWRVIRQTDAIAVMLTLYPLMGERRQARIREIVLMWRNKKDKRYLLREEALRGER